MAKIFPRYMQHATVTGRLSSIDPNQQNWPRPSTPEGKAIRNLIRARPGHVLVGCDYSQGEFRIVAWLAQAKWALSVFNDPTRKIFREFATRFYGPDFTGEQYTRMKNVTYGSFTVGLQNTSQHTQGTYWRPRNYNGSYCVKHAQRSPDGSTIHGIGS